jgi:hypothetical protein
LQYRRRQVADNQVSPIVVFGCIALCAFNFDGCVDPSLVEFSSAISLSLSVGAV